MIRWFRSIATTSVPDDPAGTVRGFGADRNPERLVFFSDAVFAIAVTLLVLEIRPPQDTRHLLHGLAALWPSYLAYAITFNVIWGYARHHHRLLGTTIDSVGPEPSAAASGSPSPGSPPEPCWAPCSPSSAWP